MYASGSPPFGPCQLGSCAWSASKGRAASRLACSRTGDALLAGPSQARARESRDASRACTAARGSEFRANPAAELARDIASCTRTRERLRSVQLQLQLVVAGGSSASEEHSIGAQLRLNSPDRCSTAGRGRKTPRARNPGHFKIYIRLIRKANSRISLVRND